MEIIGYRFHNLQVGNKVKIGNRIVGSSITWGS